MLFQDVGMPGAAGRAVVEEQVILASYLAVKKRMHAVYRTKVSRRIGAMVQYQLAAMSRGPLRIRGVRRRPVRARRGGLQLLQVERRGCSSMRQANCTRPRRREVTVTTA